MVRRSARVFAGLMVMGLLTALLAIPAAAKSRSAVPAAQQGVTKDEIEIVLIVPDIDALKAKGVSSTASTSTFEKKFTSYVDAWGKITAGPPR